MYVETTKRSIMEFSPLVNAWILVFLDQILYSSSHRIAPSEDIDVKWVGKISIWIEHKHALSIKLNGKLSTLARMCYSWRDSKSKRQNYYVGRSEVAG